MNNILVPYDFSDIAKHALDFAAQIARKATSDAVTLINVIEQPTPSDFKTMGVSNIDPMDNLWIKKMIETMEGKMKAIMADSSFKDIKLNYKIVLGNPFKELAQEIKTSGTDLVVMGTSGSSGAEEFLVGSNAERMVRFSSAPVITVSKSSSLEAVNDIVFASNFHEVPADFIAHVKALQGLFGAKLRLVKINTPASFTTTRHDKKQMEDFITKNEIQNCTYETFNDSSEEEGVLAYAEDINADMIALGTKQRRGLGHFLAGSIAEDVVNHAKVPVWTFGLEHA
ncbi:MAG: universal stress protein [Marinoscillum sp.]